MVVVLLITGAVVGSFYYFYWIQGGPQPFPENKISFTVTVVDIAPLIAPENYEKRTVRLGLKK